VQAMREAFIGGGVRTAIGGFRRSLAPLGAADLGTIVAVEALRRSGLHGSAVDELLLGCVLQAGLGQNVARQVALRTGMPRERTAMTVNMLCGSGLRSVCLAAQAIRCGDAEVVLAGGTESMSNAPYLLGKARSGYGLGHGELVDAAIQDGLWDAFYHGHMGLTAENLADRYGLTRQAQDAFAAQSHARAAAALSTGRFKEEITPVGVPRAKGDPLQFETDECVRSDTSREILATLRPAFKPDGSVTAGNSSTLNDGAACVVVASGEAVGRYGLNPMGRVVSYAYTGTDPAFMGIGPVQAMRDALARAGWTLAEVDLIELNEAFAAQALAVAAELGIEPAKLNVNGGAIALGHPIGASGARILVTLLHELRRRGAQKGVAALCIGGGMGIALCVEGV
jgi:acetyl-CoA C-acetyltransferase